MRNYYLRLFSSLSLNIICLSHLALAQQKKVSTVDVNPLLSYQEQVRELNAECAGDRSNKLCAERRKAIQTEKDKLKELCIDQPEDDRCTVFFKPRLKPGWRTEEFCSEHPRADFCMKRIEENKRRDKRKRQFCRKNPEAKPCMASSAPAKPEYNTMAEYCRANPKNYRCKKIAERKRQKMLAQGPETNVF